jgi:hypothetical protein
MLAKLIRALETEQQTFAADALVKPRTLDASEYGRVSGIYQGLERAKQLIQKVIADEDERERAEPTFD